MDKNIEHYDVCIIGGSIAGNYLCFLLSKTKLKIVVIEEHKEIGLPVQCAGIISQKLSELIDLPHEIVLNRVDIVKLVTPSGKFIRLSGNERPYIIDRAALDKLFYEKVKHNPNIRYYFEERFRSFKYKYLVQEKEQIILVETSKRKLTAKILVGCDGPQSSVAKLMGIENNKLYATQIRIQGNFRDDEVVMYFDPQWKELFGWIIPEGFNNIYRIGLASGRNVARNFHIFLNKLKIDSSNAIERQGGIIPYGVLNKSAFDNVLLLGDSACQVKATTGGGIIMLLTCAKYAANCIVKSFKKSNFSSNFIKRFYERPCQTIVGKQLKIHYLIRTILELFTNHDYEKLFQIIKTSKIEHIISIYGDMDFPKGLLIKLMKNPSFSSFIMKFVLKKPNIFVRFLKILMN
ncbi:MAG: FAD-dependent monooxygenase [Promethearchaeota archaeon]